MGCPGMDWRVTWQEGQADGEVRREPLSEWEPHEGSRDTWEVGYG